MIKLNADDARIDVASKSRWVRVGLATFLFGAWLYSLYSWTLYPQGAITTVAMLTGFAALGLSIWAFPVRHDASRRVLRVFGLVILLGAVGLLVLLIGMLRAGL